MIKIDTSLTPQALEGDAKRVFEASAPKITALQKRWKDADGTPVFTVKGRYTSRGWTEWTQGFQFGRAILQFDATGDVEMLRIGRQGTLDRMAPHVTHTGVHDHGFNNVSTYGNLRRLLREGRLSGGEWEGHFYDLALKASGAVQASRWTQLGPDSGYVYSFNGPHSLFGTIRTMRAMAWRTSRSLSVGKMTRQPRCWGASSSTPTTSRYSIMAAGGDICRARPRGARTGLQHERRQLPLSEFPAGLFTLLHMDARTRVDPLRVSRTA